MATINCLNEPTVATGKILQGQGVGVASNFSTATYPAIATGTGTILRADGTNYVASTATYPNTAASADIIYGTGSNVIGSLAAPTTRWQVGTRLNYSGSSPNWMNFAKEIYLYEEWINSAAAGALGWFTQNGGTATITVNDVVSPTVVGNVTLNTGTGASANAVVALGDNLRPMTFSGGRCVLTFLAKLTRLSTAASRFITTIGFISNSGLPFSAGVYFRYSDNANSGNWQMLATDASSTTTTNSTTAADTNWHKYTVDINAAATTATLYIDGVSIGTVGTTIPQATGTTHCCQPGCEIENASGTQGVSSSISVDAMWMYQLLTTQR